MKGQRRDITTKSSTAITGILFKTRIVTYYIGHSSHGLWGLVWSDFINRNLVCDIESLIYHFMFVCNDTLFIINENYGDKTITSVRSGERWVSVKDREEKVSSKV